MAALTLVDTSAWVEFLRRTGSAADLALDERQRHDPGSVTMAPPIAMELLLGPTDELAVRRIERLVASVPSLDVVPELDFGAAATLYRAARRSGRAPRSTVDRNGDYALISLLKRSMSALRCAIKAAQSIFFLSATCAGELNKISLLISSGSLMSVVTP